MGREIQIPSQVMVAPSGRIYTWEYLQWLVEQDRRRRRKMLILGIPSLVCILAGVAVLLVFLLGGSGISEDDYKDKASSLQNEVVLELNRLEGEWDKSNLVGDIARLEEFETLISCCEDALRETKEAPAELEKVDYPKTAASLQNELLDFYREAESTLDRMMNIFLYMKDAQKLLDSWLNEPWATESLPEEFNKLDVIKCIDKDISRYKQYSDKLLTLEPSGEAKLINDALVEEMNGMKDWLERLKMAILSYDLRTCEQLFKEYDDYVAKFEDKMLEIMDPYYKLEEEFWDLVNRGEILRDKVDRFNRPSYEPEEEEKVTEKGCNILVGNV